MNETFEGRCSCGELTYRMTSPPMITHCCHCRYCQRETGASFALNALIEADRVEVLTGKTTEAKIPSESGEGLIMERCAKCQVPVWTHYMNDRFSCWVRVGTLLEPDRIAPDVHIFTESKQPWLILPEGVPFFEKFYDWDNRSDVWSAESIARDEVLVEQMEAEQSGL